MDLFMRLSKEIYEKANIPISTDGRKAVSIGGPSVIDSNGVYVEPNGVDYYGNPTKEAIYILVPPTDTRIIAVLFHELSHATGHRLGRDMCKNRSMEEVVAEMSCKLLLQHFQLNTEESDNRNQRYIESWSWELSSIQIDICKQRSYQAYWHILRYWLYNIEVTKTKEAV